MEWCKVKLIELDDRAIVNRKINRGTLYTNIKGISNRAHIPKTDGERTAPKKYRSGGL